MSGLGTTLVAVSLLASVGCGTAIALIVAYRTEWKPLIAALTSRCEAHDRDYRAVIRAYTARESEYRREIERLKREDRS